jgi:hypothetical protein
MLLLGLIAESFVIGWIFWVTIIGLSLTCIISEVTEWEPGSTLGLVLLAIGLYYVTEPFGAAFSAITHNPVNALVVILSYFAIGALYSVIRWWRYCANKIEDIKEMFGEIRDGDYASHMSYMVNITLKVSNNKSLIFLWIGYWPISSIWLILNDPITKIVKWIFHQLRSIYESISEAVTSEAKQEVAAIKARIDQERV